MADDHLDAEHGSSGDALPASSDRPARDAKAGTSASAHDADSPEPRDRGTHAANSRDQDTGSSRHDLRTLRAHQLRRALLLTGLSTIWPGLGLSFTRRRVLGLVLAAGALITALVIGIKLYSAGVFEGASQFLTKQGLVTLALIVVCGSITWIIGILLTARETSGRRWSTRMRWVHRAFTALMVLIIAAPAAQAARYVWVTQDTLSTMFQKRYGGGNQAKPNGSAADPWKNVPRVNILLVGSDAGADRTGVRTDSLMVVSIDTKTGDSTLISIPRNLQRVPIPATNPLHQVYPNGYYCPSAECLMNAVWNEAENHKNLYPKDEEHVGWDTTRDVVGNLVGLKIDYSVAIDLVGFQSLVNAMGGVYINVKPDPNSPYHGIPIGGHVVNGVVVGVTGIIPPGYQKLNGTQALWYSRSRVGAQDGDDSRMRRQRCMVNALISQADPFTMITKFTSIMDVAKQNVMMDIPQDDLPAFASLVQDMKKGNLRTVNVLTAIHNKNWNPDFAAIKAAVQKAINTPHDSKAPKTGSQQSTTDSSSSSAGTSTSTAPSTSTSTSTDAVSNTADNC